MKRLVSILLILSHCTLLFGQVEEYTIKFKKGDELVVAITPGLLIYLNEDSLSKPIIINAGRWSVSHTDKKIIYRHFLKKVNIPFKNIKSIEYGIGNKALQYGLTGGLANILLFNYLGMFDGKDTGRNIILPVPIVIAGWIALLSPTLLATSFGFLTPKHYSESMIIGENDWQIVK